MGPDYVFHRKNFRFVHGSEVEMMMSEEKEFWEGYFERMKILPISRRVTLVERQMDAWENGFGVNV
jgi:hypothetical protein